MSGSLLVVAPGNARHPETIQLCFIRGVLGFRGEISKGQYTRVESIVDQAKGMCVNGRRLSARVLIMRRIYVRSSSEHHAAPIGIFPGSVLRRRLSFQRSNACAAGSGIHGKSERKKEIHRMFQARTRQQANQDRRVRASTS